MKGAVYSFIIVQVALNIKKILKKIVQDYRLKKDAALGYVGWNFVSLYFKRYRIAPFSPVERDSQGKRRRGWWKRTKAGEKQRKNCGRRKRKNLKKGLQGTKIFCRMNVYQEVAWPVFSGHCHFRGKDGDWKWSFSSSGSVRTGS